MDLYETENVIGAEKNNLTKTKNCTVRLLAGC